MRALVVTVSTRAASGVYDDRAGPVARDGLREMDFEVDGPQVVPDGDPVETALRDAVSAEYDVVVTTGGTRLTPRDLTPEITRRVIDREVPGVADAIRAPGRGGRRADRGALARDRRTGRDDADREPARLARRGPRRDRRAAGVLGHAVEQAHGGDH